MNDALVLLLRIIGTSSLCALFFVPFPYTWMDGIHQALGMGRLPDAPVVLYLARSTSLLYAILGGLMWVVSFDVARHRGVIVYLGAALTGFGIALTIIDWAEGMPTFWRWGEGPVDVVIGLGLLVLGSRVGGAAGSLAGTRTSPER